MSEHEAEGRGSSGETKGEQTNMDGCGGWRKNAMTLARRRDERYTEANRGWTRCSGALECRWTQRPTGGGERERVVGDGEEATEAPPGNRRRDNDQ